jgi:signal transduction histidine kinase
VTVTLCRRGTPGRLAPAVDLVAYRVVQEALTNVVRHAGPGTHATVTLGWAPQALTIEVSDDGHGQPLAAAAGLSTGHGLAGLTARVTALHGRLETRPSAGGGFRVSSTLPAESPDGTEPSESTIAPELSAHAVTRPAG